LEANHHYFRVSINGQWHDNEESPIDNCGPFGLPCVAHVEFSQEVDLATEPIPIVIEHWEDDLAVDDHCQIIPGVQDLSITLDLASCQISGDVSGECGTFIELGSMPSLFEFRVYIETPPSAEGLNVRCIHDPIWPQPGEEITITAEALNGVAHSITEDVDDIEIYLGEDETTPVATSSTTPGYELQNQFEYSYTPASDYESLVYRCIVSDNGERVSTGWRRVQIGDPAPVFRAVPILYTGPRRSSIDIVFIADRDSYTDPRQASFHADVKEAIEISLYSNPLFLAHQNKTNFWLALDDGDADPPDAGDVCGDLEAPHNWDDAEYSFADSGIILHTDVFGDCAEESDRLFSIQPTEYGGDALLHELGHAPFGLSDEYWEEGVRMHFESDVYPNVYRSQDDCLEDDLATDPEQNCQQIRDERTGATTDWYRLDALYTIMDDLMGYHFGSLQPADERRINWIYESCDDGEC
jgi:hypothetical protein